jgi:NAD(P)-dependent dehydrogenase (short-subunit alcohol dehydrogenase family)
MPDADNIVLITGASGFVGSAIAIAARGAGYRVRVLVRASSPRDNIQPGDDVAIGDIRDRASLANALRGVRYLIHAAADYRLWSRAPSEIIATNAEGTRCVMEEALRAGVERIVYTSSVATIALRDDTPADESSPLSESDAIGAYKKSKVIAERLVEEMVQRQRLPAVIVNPSTPRAAVCRRSWILGLIWCMSTTWPPATSRHSRAALSASVTSWAARTSTCVTCSPRSRVWSAASRRAFDCRSRHCIRSRSSPRVWVSSRGASRS